MSIKQTIAIAAFTMAMCAGGAFAATTIDSSVNVLSGQGVHYKTVTQLSAGDTITVTAQQASWVQDFRADEWLDHVR